ARMRVVMDFIRANLARADLGLDLLAGVAEMDRLYFMQAFRRVAGVMPHEYLVRLRLREAKRLLKETQLPTDVVAACLGMHAAQMRVVMDFIRANLARADLGLDLLAGVAEMDRLYFMQAFRRVAGVMPHEYLVRLRLREAKRLLKETQLPTDVVAACLGMHAA